MNIQDIKTVLNSGMQFIDKKRRLKELQISNTVSRLENTTDEKTIRYLKRKLKRQQLECRKLWC